VGAVSVLILFMAACAPKNPIKLEMTQERVVAEPGATLLVFEPSGDLDTRDRGGTVHVVLRADPALVVTYDVQRRFSGRPMEEVEPGVYRGSFEVRAGEVGELRAVAHLTDPPTGASRTVGPTGALTLFRSPPVVRTCDQAMQTSFDRQLAAVTLYFPFNVADLDEDDRTLLRAKLGVFQSNDLCAIHLFGFADGIGSADYNINLSAERANNVKQYLASLGIAASRFRIHAMGQTNPIVEGATPEELAKNRRVEFRAIDPY